MSHAATKWAIEQRGIKPAAKIVLWQLCDRYHPDNGCFPSQETLAEDCEMSRSALNTHLATLEEKGLIARETRRDPQTKQQERTRYRFPFEEGFQAKPIIVEPCAESGHGAESGKEPNPCPENDESRVRNPDTNPVREPVKEPFEREARAREPDPDPETDQGFQSLRAKIAKVRGPQTTGRSFPLWVKLAPDDRLKALNGWEACLAAWSQGGQKHAYGLETYLRDRMWEQAPQQAGDDTPKLMLGLRSGEWFAHFWARYLAGQLDVCRKMLAFGRMDVGWRCDAADVPGHDSVQAMQKVDVKSDAWSAWRRYLDGQGLRFDQNMLPAWVWVPSEWPDVTAIKRAG